jgi:hypothetical protein
LNQPTNGSLNNWCGRTPIGQPRDLHDPETELWAEAVLRSGRGERTQIVGGRYSWPSLIDVDGATTIQTHRLSGVLAIDDHSVDIAAGTQLASISAALREVGRRLACSPPVIANQTAAGAIATGTHGQGLGQSTIGDTMLSANVISPDDGLFTVTAGAPDVGAYQAHLGCLGLFTRLRFATEPNLVYTCEKAVVGFDELVRDFDTFNRHYEFCKVWWFPAEDCAHLWLVRSASRAEERAFGANDGRPVVWGDRQSELNGAVHRAIDGIARATKSTDLRQPQFLTVLRFRSYQNVAGYLDDILCQGIPAPQLNCEVGVPLADTGEALTRLRTWYRRTVPPLDYPIILRATGPSSAWLSPAHDRATCYFGFVVYQARDGSFARGAFDYLDEAQRLLAAGDGFPHWGKYFTPELYDFTRLARWDDFLRVRESRDAGGQLLNPLLRRVLTHCPTRTISHA